MNSKKIYLAALILVVVSCLSLYLGFEYKNKLTQENAEDVGINASGGQVQDLLGASDYQQARELLENGDIDDAVSMFDQLEEGNTFVEQIAHLRLKKLHATLLGGDYQKSADLLVEIVSNPTFPDPVKARAMESVLMTYKGGGNDVNVSRPVFYSDFFSGFMRQTSEESWYEYFRYSYDLYPTTVIGRHMVLIDLYLYRQMDEGAEKERKKQEIDTFVTDFFVNSDNEIEQLLKFPNQDSLLVSIYSDRADVILKVTENEIREFSDRSAHDEFYQAYEHALLFGADFHKYYVAVRYLDYLYRTDSPADPRLKNVLLDESIFTSSNITKLNYQVSIGTGKEWTDDELNFISEKSPGFFNLIQKHEG